MYKLLTFKSAAASRAASTRPSIRRERRTLRSVPADQPKAETAQNAAVINEDVLARLRAAEDEAIRLREELAALQRDKDTQLGSEDVIEEKRNRIDGTDNRENLVFMGPPETKRSSWLSEADVDFFTAAGPSEVVEVDEESKQIVQRRLAIGLVVGAGLGALSFIPTETLRLRPPKPLFFYLVPLLQAQALLADCGQLIADADWVSLRAVLARLTGPPFSVKDNLQAAAAWLDDTRTAARCGELASELTEYLADMDYNKYFDAMPRAAVSGAQQAQFVEFSSSALKAAQRKLSEALALMPEEDLAAARQQAGPTAEL